MFDENVMTDWICEAGYAINSQFLSCWKKKKKAPVKRIHGNIRSAAVALSQSVSAEGHGVTHTGRPADKKTQSESSTDWYTGGGEMVRLCFASAAMQKETP